MIEFLSRLSRLLHLATVGCLIAIVGIVDYTTGYELSFSVFYLLPIFYAVSFIGGRAGVVVSIISAAIWLQADISSGHVYSHPAIPYWNTLVRLAFFLIFTYLFSRLQSALTTAKQLAQLDPLTGIVNSRVFYERVGSELERSRRTTRPFTIAYLDLDNFKFVNDTFGHSTGDTLLRLVARTISETIRATDCVARMGGDEFALLLPETQDDFAHSVIDRVYQHLSDAMQAHGWPVTCSIGVATFMSPPPTVDALIQKADELMYAVKHSGKNSVQYETLGMVQGGAMPGRRSLDVRRDP